jgi:hypothetical protein
MSLGQMLLLPTCTPSADKAAGSRLCSCESIAVHHVQEELRSRIRPLSCLQVEVVRIKNRLDPDYDARWTAGYR